MLQAAARLFLGQPAFEPGPWDEYAAWMDLGLSGGVVSHKPASVDFDATGLYFETGESSRASMRAARFLARPAHSDQMHVDIWWNHVNVVRDPGTYRYTAPSPWRNPFSSARVHNTVTIDRAEPMDRAGRFLWLNWTSARFLGRWSAPDESVSAMAAEHQINANLRHRRTVLRAGTSLWVVLDEILGTGVHSARIVWNTVDRAWNLEQQILKLDGGGDPMGVSLTPRLDSVALYRAGERIAGTDEDSENSDLLGWWSPTYGYKEPALTLVGSITGELPLRITSWWRLGEQKPDELSLGSLHEDPLLAFLSGGTGPLRKTDSSQ